MCSAPDALAILWSDDASDSIANGNTDDMTDSIGETGGNAAAVCGEARWIEAALRRAYAPWAAVRAQVDIAIVDGEAIRAINRQTRGVDEITDVLSFPMIRLRRPARTDQLRGRSIDPDTGRVALGDIVICQERAGEQAAALSHSIAREMGFLAVHGLLHLLGYDHLTPDEESAMVHAASSALHAVGLDRDGLGEELARRAEAACDRAYAPYSGYRVGACLLAGDGAMVDGVNVENASYGATLCAERNAVAAAIAQGATGFTMIAVAAETPPVPCGICRQVLHEFAPELRILVLGRDRIDAYGCDELLPRAFGASAFMKEGGRASDQSDGAL